MTDVTIKLKEMNCHQQQLNVSESSNIRLQHTTAAAVLGPDFQNILRQSYDYLTIMPKLRSTYDGRLIY